MIDPPDTRFNGMPRTERFLFIDAARTYAVILALLSHFLRPSGVASELGQNILYINQFTRMATPMFLCIYGFLIEYVYVPKVEAGGAALSFAGICGAV